MKDLRHLKKWRDALRKEFTELDGKKEEQGEDTSVPAILQKTEEELEDEELQEMDKKISELQVISPSYTFNLALYSRNFTANISAIPIISTARIHADCQPDHEIEHSSFFSRKKGGLSGEKRKKSRRKSRKGSSDST